MTITVIYSPGDAIAVIASYNKGKNMSFFYIIDHANKTVIPQSVSYGSAKIKLLAYNEEEKLYAIHIPGHTAYVDRETKLAYGASEIVILKAENSKPWGNSQERIECRSYNGVMQWNTKQPKESRK